MRITFLLPFVFPAMALTAAAQEIPETPPVTHPAGMSFEDAAFAVENAIIGAGLVIDSESHVGAMLSRTKEDVGGAKDIFADAVIFNFCSAEVSRQVMEVDPQSLQHCPYGIFVYQTGGSDEVVVGRRAYSANMAPVAELLDGIIKDALALQ